MRSINSFSFLAALSLHVFLLCLLYFEPSQSHYVVEKKEMTEAPPSNVKAIAIDEKEVIETVRQLKQEKLEKALAEQRHQALLKAQAEKVKQEREREQTRLQQIRQARKKELEQLAIRKKEEERRLAEVKEAQQREARQLAIQKAKAKAMEEEIKARDEKIKQAYERDRLEAKRQAMNGEVNKYKALIIAAISQQWILPENANKLLSSQFKIRLAPNGSVLEVHLSRSSGDPILDRSAQAAIFKASPLPVPKDPSTFEMFREISLTVRPENARG